MSYTVLARKYRSRNFDELVGQEHIARTLKKAIDSGRIAHAFLFCGTRGTGKTSTARILAKCLNCEKSDKPTTHPCDVCEACKGIARGDDIDVIEIDAASNTGVDNVRDIIANAGYRPARSRFKVYIIDEVHMLSKAAFNALLKTLEEPPEHVKFILATTEPEKVLPTILSRCQRYDFRNIPTREIVDHLKDITKQEKIKADEDALFLVAKAGAGSMRDSLSLLDRLLSVGEKELTVEMIEQLLGLPKSQLIFDLAQAIGEANVKEALTQADKIIAGGLAADTLIASLVDHLRNLLILRTCGPDSKLVEVPGLAMKELQGQAARFDPVVLTQDIALLEELRRQMRTSQAGRALLDATLVRLALAEQFNQIGELLSGAAAGGGDGASAGPALKKKYDEPVSAARAAVTRDFTAPVMAEPESDDLPPSPRYPGERVGERGERRTESNDARLHGSPAPGPSPLPGATREGERATPSASPAVTAPVAVDDDDDALPAVGKVWDSSGPSLSELLKQRSATPAAAREDAPVPAPAHPESNVEPVDVRNLPEVWQRMLDLLSAKGPMLLSLVTPARLTAIEDGLAVVRYERRHETFVKMLERNGKKDAVRDALAQAAGENLGLKFEIDPAGGDSEAASGGGIGAGSGATAATTSAPSAVRAIAVAPPAMPARPPLRRETPPAAPPPRAMAEPAVNLVKVTPELIESLKSAEPLIKGLIDELGAQIVKVEPPESATADAD